MRVSLGLSFYDETSMVETVGSLRFTSDNENSVPEMRHGQEGTDVIDIATYPSQSSLT